MEAKELMIGDWVLVPNQGYCKVWEIAKDEQRKDYISIACSATLFRIYEFEPIPLTPEILELNGISCDLTEIYTSLKIGTKNSYDISCERGKFYVHELHHALRLCGLNELADNFKVE